VYVEVLRVVLSGCWTGLWSCGGSSTQPEQKRKEKSDKKYHRSLSKKRLKNWTMTMMTMTNDHDVKKKRKKW
jgi:hypothetical protein